MTGRSFSVCDRRSSHRAAARGPVRLACLALALATLPACSRNGAPGVPPAAPASPPAAPGLALAGDISPVHDPTIIMEGGSTHVFSTSQVGEAPGLIHWRTSTDLLSWTRNGAVFTEMPGWASEAVAPKIVTRMSQF